MGSIYGYHCRASCVELQPLNFSLCYCWLQGCVVSKYFDDANCVIISLRNTVPTHTHSDAVRMC